MSHRVSQSIFRFCSHQFQFRYFVSQPQNLSVKTHGSWALFQNSKMASRFSHHLLCIRSPYTSPSSNSPKLVTNPNCAVRVRAVPRTSPRKNPSTSLETSSKELKHPISSKRGDRSDSNSSSVSTLFGSFSVLIRRLRYCGWCS